MSTVEATVDSGALRPAPWLADPSLPGYRPYLTADGRVVYFSPFYDQPAEGYAAAWDAAHATSRSASQVLTTRSGSTPHSSARAHP